MKYCFIDFEFNSTAEKHVEIYCVACLIVDTDRPGNFMPYSKWLYKNEKEKELFVSAIKQLQREQATFVSWSVEAEARCFIALGLNPTEFNWYDLYLEYRMLTNHNHELQYGEQLIDGKIVKTFPPEKKKWMNPQAAKKLRFDKPSHSLAAATFKLLKQMRDTEHKEKMRNLIITARGDIVGEDREAILKYCEEDVIHLPKIFEEMKKHYTKLIPKKEKPNLKKEMLLRGDYAARTAVMSTEGYPVNVEWVESFSHSTKDIISQVQGEINSYFPEMMPFEYNKRTGFYVQKRKKISEWIANYCKETGVDWPKTATGDYEQSLEVWEDYFDFKHDYPTNSFPAQFIRLGRINQSLNGFKPPKAKSDKKQFWEYLGKDGVVRPHMGIYSAQSARSQPSAISFIPLKAAWMRSLIMPPKGMAMAALDYKSEEFLIGAGNSMDRNMIESYKSGDVYFHFAKLARAVPMNAQRKDYEHIRDKFKSTTLAIQYLMGPESLSRKIRIDTGQPCTEDEAQDLINLFNETYNDFYLYREEVIERYGMEGYIKLFDGWYMFGDNYNHRSVANVPIQGMGSVIMRRAVKLCQDAGIRINYTLHDALYIIFPSHDLEILDKVAKLMKEAFKWPYIGSPVEKDMDVGIDIKIWSQDYPEEEIEIKTPDGYKVLRQRIHVDKRSVTEYEKFKKYFNRQQLTDLI